MCCNQYNYLGFDNCICHRKKEEIAASKKGLTSQFNCEDNIELDEHISYKIESKDDTLTIT